MREREDVTDAVAGVIERVKRDCPGGKERLVAHAVGVGLQLLLRGDVVDLDERGDAHVPPEGGLARLRIVVDGRCDHGLLQIRVGADADEDVRRVEDVFLI